MLFCQGSVWSFGWFLRSIVVATPAVGFVFCLLNYRMLSFVALMQVLSLHTLETVPTIATCHMRAATRMLPRRHEPVSRYRSFKSSTFGASLSRVSAK
jgi:hypothetical protein